MRGSYMLSNKKNQRLFCLLLVLLVSGCNLIGAEDCRHNSINLMTGNTFGMQYLIGSSLLNFPEGEIECEPVMRGAANVSYDVEDDIYEITLNSENVVGSIVIPNIAISNNEDVKVSFYLEREHFVSDEGLLTLTTLDNGMIDGSFTAKMIEANIGCFTCRTAVIAGRFLIVGSERDSPHKH